MRSSTREFTKELQGKYFWLKSLTLKWKKEFCKQRIQFIVFSYFSIRDGGLKMCVELPWPVDDGHGFFFKIWYLWPQLMVGKNHGKGVSFSWVQLFPHSVLLSLLVICLYLGIRWPLAFHQDVLDVALPLDVSPEQYPWLRTKPTSPPSSALSSSRSWFSSPDMTTW